MCERENDLRTSGLFLRVNGLAGHTTVVTYPLSHVVGKLLGDP